METPTPCTARSHYWSLWSYLQGMETEKNSDPWIRLQRSFDPTYKGWKRINSYESQHPMWRLWSYLQGMETFYFEILTHNSIICFDPTYKGWKQEQYKGLTEAIKGFDPTYKGWKRDVVKENTRVIQGFDPTYKGWKLFFCVWARKKLNVLWSYLQGMETTLPVCLCVYPTSALWSYLQGMETADYVFYIHFILPLWSYLQGMETLKHTWRWFFLF